MNRVRLGGGRGDISARARFLLLHTRVFRSAFRLAENPIIRRIGILANILTRAIRTNSHPRTTRTHCLCPAEGKRVLDRNVAFEEFRGPRSSAISNQ